MNCSFAEKVSMIIDGELTEPEIGKVRAHIAECADCRQMEKDSLFFREQLRESAAESTANKIKTPIAKGFPFWKKGISVPVQVFSILLLIFGGLSIGLIVWRSDQTGKIVVENPVKRLPVKGEKADELSISRFDKGGRAEIYVAPRQER